MAKSFLLAQNKKKNNYRDLDPDENNMLAINHRPNKEQRRRPIQNWTKAWRDHKDEADIIDDFH
jgi:hypothetical protein